ncbi:MAG: hypothetical protein ACP5GG_01265, partial [Conexivisphaera sp.]
RLEEAMRDLATIVAEGASNSGLEVHEENGGDELLILRVKRVLHPSELDLPIVDVLRNYTQRLEEYVSGVLDGV